jgi:hypothetical protein
MFVRRTYVSGNVSMYVMNHAQVARHWRGFEVYTPVQSTDTEHESGFIAHGKPASARPHRARQRNGASNESDGWESRRVYEMDGTGHQPGMAMPYEHGRMVHGGHRCGVELELVLTIIAA